MRKTDKVIITSATTGAAHMPWMSDHIPLTPDQIVADSVAAAEAGAAIIHLHARDPDTGRPSTEPAHYAAFLSRIKQQTGAVVNITTGQPHLGTIDEQLEARLLAPREFAPEICSFNMGPLNGGAWMLEERANRSGKALRDWEREFIAAGKMAMMFNPFGYMERVARELGEERGVKFEFECFDIGHLYALRVIADQGWVKPPFFIQGVFGFPGGLAAEPRHVMHFRDTADQLFGDDYIWSCLAVGKRQIPITTLSAVMGGNVRVGMEDSLWDGRKRLAESSADQVRRIRTILEALDLPIATPDEAREILGTKGPDRVNF